MVIFVVAMIAMVTMVASGFQEAGSFRGGEESKEDD